MAGRSIEARFPMPGRHRRRQRPTATVRPLRPDDSPSIPSGLPSQGATCPQMPWLSGVSSVAGDSEGVGDARVSGFRVWAMCPSNRTHCASAKNLGHPHRAPPLKDDPPIIGRRLGHRKLETTPHDPTPCAPFARTNERVRRADSRELRCRRSLVFAPRSLGGSFRGPFPKEIRTLFR